MAYAIPSSAGWLELVSGTPFRTEDGTQYPANWLDHASAEDIAAIGGVEIAEPPAAPDGKVNRLTGIADQAGVPTRTYEVEDAPAPPTEPVYDPRGLIATLSGAIDEDGGVGGVANATGLQGAMELQPGVYWFFFAQSLPDPDYIVLPGYSDPALIFDMKATYQEADFVEVTAVDRATGDPARPAGISVTVFR